MPLKTPLGHDLIFGVSTKVEPRCLTGISQRGLLVDGCVFCIVINVVNVLKKIV